MLSPYQLSFMIKYVLKLLAGCDPRRVIESMPPEDFEKVSSFVSNLGNSGIPRKHRRVIEKRWEKVYGTKRPAHKKI